MKTARFFLTAAAIFLAACSLEQPPAQAETGFKTGLAGIDRIEIMILESYPVQVHVVVHGWLSDGCTELHGSEQTTEGNIITLRITTRRPTGVMCTMAIRKFKETYPVDTKGLAPGVYKLDVNGTVAEFTLP